MKNLLLGQGHRNTLVIHLLGGPAVTESDTAGTASAAEGNTVISQNTTEVTISTCIETGCATDDIKSNVVSIE